MRFLVWLACLLSERAARAVGAFLGILWFHVVHVRRGVALSNLAIALPEKNAAERRAIARDAFRNLGIGLLELLRVPLLTAEWVRAHVLWEGREHLDAAFGNGRGVLVVTAHFGNWDLLACSQALAGDKVTVVTRTLKGRRSHAAWTRLRESTGLRLVPAQGSLSDILVALRRNEIVAFVIDQHMPAKLGIAVPFFGRPASTIDAVATLALRTGAAVVPVFLVRDGERHRVICWPEVPLERLPSRRETIARNTARYNAVLETMIRRYPDHWMWVHRRWKLPEGIALAAGAGAVPNEDAVHGPA